MAERGKNFSYFTCRPDGKVEDNHSQPKQWFLAAALVLACGLLLRVVFLEAPQYTDDLSYLTIAADYPAETGDGRASPLFFQAGLLLPLKLMTAVFGYGLFTYYLFSITAFMLLLGSLLAAARTAAGVSAAVIAAALAGSSALVLHGGSLVGPDLPSLAFLLLAFVAFQRSVKVESGGWRALVAAVVLGFTAYLFRGTSAVWLCCLPLYELLERRSVRKSLAGAGLFLGLLTAESIYYAVLLGDPLARIRVAAGAWFGWTGEVAALSAADCVLGPVFCVTRWVTGVALLLVAIPGFVMAWRRRNWSLICLAAGGLALFVLSGFDPLTRAGRLNNRHVLALTVALAVSSGYFLSQLKDRQWSCRWSPVLRWGWLAGVLVMVATDLAELPGTVGGRAILCGQGEYFLADRLLDRPSTKSKIADTVYAAPLAAFRLHRHASELPLEDLLTNEIPRPGRLVLYSKEFLRTRLQSIEQRYGTDDPRARTALDAFHYYRDRQAGWEYLLDSGDIVLAQVGAIAPGTSAVLDLADPQAARTVWVAQSEDDSTGTAEIRTDGGHVAFHLSAQFGGTRFHTFQGQWTTPPVGEEGALVALCDGASLECHLAYKLTETVRSLSVVILEFDEEKQLGSKKFFLPRSKGPHQLKGRMRLSDRARYFRISLGVATEHPSVLEFRKFDVGFRDEMPPGIHVARRLSGK